VLVSGKRIIISSPDCMMLNLGHPLLGSLCMSCLRFLQSIWAILFCASICGRPLKEQNHIERSSRVNLDVRFAIRLFVLPKYWEYARLPNNDQADLSQAFEEAIVCQATGSCRTYIASHPRSILIDARREYLSEYCQLYSVSNARSRRPSGMQCEVCIPPVSWSHVCFT
jgi:hypothetical protein